MFPDNTLWDDIDKLSLLLGITKGMINDAKYMNHKETLMHNNNNGIKLNLSYSRLQAELRATTFNTWKYLNIKHIQIIS